MPLIELPNNTNITETILNTSTLPSGLYFVKIENSKGSVVRKIIKE
jgi:hypothetical protein